MEKLTKVAHRIASSLETTPALVYSEEILEHNLVVMVRSLERGGLSNYGIHFAIKACYCPRVLAWLATRAGCEVISALELALAKNAGFCGSSIISNGSGRSGDMLKELLALDALVNFDTEGDLRRYLEISRQSGKSPRVGVRLRLNGVLRDKSCEGKVGVSRNCLNKFLTPLLDFKQARLETLQIHIGQQETTSDIYIKALKQLIHMKEVIKKIDPQFDIACLDLGGGIFEPWESYDQAEAIFGDIGRLSSNHKEFRILLEPGRYLVGNAGFATTTVLDIKTDGTPPTVIVDCGTNVLIPISTARYRLAWPTLGRSAGVVADIADGITNDNNILVKRADFPRLPVPGERLVIGNCGAYTMSMAAYWVYDWLPIYWLNHNNSISTVLSNQSIREARNLLLGV